MISVGELGEFGLIARITARFPVGPATAVGRAPIAAMSARLAAAARRPTS
jgi:hypothetical protein